jgi:four helix bundle protein
MTNDECRNEDPRVFDLEERTAVFSEAVIDFALAIKRNAVVAPLLTQLIKSATSIGANYCEADDAESKKDFRHKMGLAARKLAKLNTGSEWSLARFRNQRNRPDRFGKRFTNST